jgi:hypothetical protein
VRGDRTGAGRSPRVQSPREGPFGFSCAPKSLEGTVPPVRAPSEGVRLCCPRPVPVANTRPDVQIARRCTRRLLSHKSLDTHGLVLAARRGNPKLIRRWPSSRFNEQCHEHKPPHVGLRLIGIARYMCP